MSGLTEPQVWTLIAVFAASTFAMIGLMSSTFVRILRAEIAGLHGEMTGLRGEVTGLRGEMNARFERVDDRLDHLDRDVQAPTRHVFGRPTD